MHHELPPPAGPELEHLEGVGEAARPPPAGQELRPSERLEDTLGRMRENPMRPKYSVLVQGSSPSSESSYTPWRTPRPSALRARRHSSGRSGGRARRPARS